MPHLPTTKALKDILDGLLGRDVYLREAKPIGEGDVAGGILARYVDDQGSPRAVAGWDLAGGAFVGAAVGLVPRGGAEAALEDGELSPNLFENLSEVSNVFAQAFNVPGNPHVRLEQCFHPLESAPDDARELLFAPALRLDYEVDVDGYGKGKLSISMVG